MKKIFIKVLKTLTIIIMVILLLAGVYFIVKAIGIKGVPSEVLWDESVQFDPSDINKVVRKDGEDFKILLFSDIQIGANIFKDTKTLEMMDGLVNQTNPDFIMTTGDNTYLFLSEVMTNILIEKMAGYDIPWGVTLGNHDSEGVADRNWYGNKYESAKNSVFEMGPKNIYGVGNYVVDIIDANGNPLYSLIMMDSNEHRQYDYANDYDYIHSDQIHWYEWVVNGQKDVPSMLFFHIPLPEFEEAKNMLKAGQLDIGLGFGEDRENVSAPPMNSGLFDKVVELGNTTHIFVGHDHINNLSIDFRGVRLTYGLKTGPSSYSDEDMQGATLIIIKDGSNEVVVEHIYYNKQL